MSFLKRSSSLYIIIAIVVILVSSVIITIYTTISSSPTITAITTTGFSTSTSSVSLTTITSLTEATTYSIDENIKNTLAETINVKRENLKIIHLTETKLDSIYAVLALSIEKPPKSVGILYDKESTSIKEIAFVYTPSSEVEIMIFNLFINKCKCPFCGSSTCLPSRIMKFNQTHFKIEYYDGWSVIGKHWSRGLALLNMDTQEITYIEHTK